MGWTEGWMKRDWVGLCSHAGQQQRPASHAHACTPACCVAQQQQQQQCRRRGCVVMDPRMHARLVHRR